MRTHLGIASLFISFSLIIAQSCVAKEPKSRRVVHDGSTLERAIVVTEPDSTYVHWIVQYLSDHFPARTFPKGHGFITDEFHGRAWIVHHFAVDGRQKEVWFDITKQYREFAKVPTDVK
jgi:hypothetical protein